MRFALMEINLVKILLGPPDNIYGGQSYFHFQTS